jgi:hypothetical protein
LSVAIFLRKLVNLFTLAYLGNPYAIWSLLGMSYVVTLALSAYAMVALIFFGFTLDEGIEKQAKWDVCRMAGLVACIFWPGVLFLGIREALSIRADEVSDRRSR